MKTFDKIVHDITAQTGYPPTKYQIDIFKHLSKGSGHTIVNAVAGSGKTTTLRMATAFLPSTASILFAAFNKHIADELSRGLPSNVCATTLNSFGFRALRAGVKRLGKLDTDKTANLLYAELGRPHKGDSDMQIFQQYRACVSRLVSLMKANGFGIDSIRPGEITEAEMVELAMRYQIEIPGEPSFLHRVLLVPVYRAAISDTSVIDFDDQLYMPVHRNLAIPSYDFVFVDESQDLNIVQAELVRRCAKRAVFVGDPFQSIYGFRGANPDAMDYIARTFSTTELPLSICWRCGSSIVKTAQSIVPHIEPSPKAPEGVVRSIPMDNLASEAKPGDNVLCRTTAPLVSECLAMLREGRKAIVRGRDIGRSLEAMLDKIEKKAGSTNPIDAIHEWGEIEREKLMRSSKTEALLQRLEDQIATLLALSTGQSTFADVRQRIATVFSDTDEGVVFSTIHKAKGLEADRVFIIRPDLLPHPMAKQEWERKQETNLKYVAITRARKELVWVTGERSKNTKGAANAKDNRSVSSNVPAGA